jgi:dTDP-4-dehydrorhamnose reductase
MLRFVVFGPNGYLGDKICQMLERDGHGVYKVPRRVLNGRFPPLASGLNAIKEFDPDYVINAIGYTGKPNVDECEEKQRECFEGNVLVPTLIADFCHTLGVPLIHLSSGCIYNDPAEDGKVNGHSGWKFLEEDKPNFCFGARQPCSYYSGTKELGERAVRNYTNSYILRIRMPFNADAHSKNYLWKLLKYEKLLDAQNSMTYVSDLLRAITHIAEELPEPGTYHIVSPPTTTRQVTKILSRAGLFEDREPQFFADIEEFNQHVKTPRSNCMLCNDKARAAGFKFVDVESALRTSAEKLRRLLLDIHGKVQV